MSNRRAAGPGSPGEIASLQGHLRVPFHPSSAGVARRQLGSWLRRHGGGVAAIDLDSLVDCAALVVSELVGNAVRHARPVIGGVLSLSWCWTPEGLLISVTDGGSAVVPRQVEAATMAQSGRGLAIIDSLATRWWTELTPQRATVHAVIGRA